MLDEGRLWFSEIGNERLEIDVDVQPRIARSLSVEVAAGPPELAARTEAALARQDEPVTSDGEARAMLLAGCEPAPDWSRRVLDALQAGWAAVGGSIELQGFGRRHGLHELGPWKPGFGRAPTWAHPLLCPALGNEVLHVATWLEPLLGLPTLDTGSFPEPWVCDGRARVAVPVRALRPSGRRAGER